MNFRDNLSVMIEFCIGYSSRMSKYVDHFNVNWTKLTFAAASFYIGLLHLDYIDIEYSAWLCWLLAPLLVTFILPAVIAVLIYMSALIYQLRRAPIRLQNWRSVIMAVWDAHGRLWHGYEVIGLEKIPAKGAAMLIFYHGALPIDMYYLTARVCLTTGGSRLIRSVVDRALFMVPGWRGILQAMQALPGARGACARELRVGELLAVAPGGVYEAQYGDHGYQLVWKSRVGFAKVALSTGVPIYPIFTRNIREAFRTASWFLNFFPMAPIYGGFPVKLVTYIGDPIYPIMSPEKSLTASLPELPLSDENIIKQVEEQCSERAQHEEGHFAMDRRKKKCVENADPSDSVQNKINNNNVGHGEPPVERTPNKDSPKSEQSPDTQSEDVALAWELRKRVESALEDLISTHQRVPGSILWALLDRFVTVKPVNVESQ